MIKSFNHKGLKKLFTTGSKAGIIPNHSAKLEVILQALHTAMVLEDMNIPGWNLHPLHGNLEGKWAVKVSGNWRVFFEFIDGHAYIVDYNDYH